MPPLIYFGKADIHKQVINEVKSGDKLISLAISELTGGSDVANLKTTAVKDGNDYIVNGNKYWVFKFLFFVFCFLFCKYK